MKPELLSVFALIENGIGNNSPLKIETISSISKAGKTPFL
jgi:hypothetical protein